MSTYTGWHFDCSWTWSLDPLVFDLSTLSSNQPKNGAGDPRECAIDGCQGAQATAGDPINTHTGALDFSWVDLSVPTAAGPLTFQRSYSSDADALQAYTTPLGAGWTHNQDTRLIFDTGMVWFKAHTANQYQFTDNGDGTYTPYAGVLASLTTRTNPEDDSAEYVLTASDQSVYTFYGDGDLKGLVKTWTNPLNQGFVYQYNASNQLEAVSDTTGQRWMQITYGDGQTLDSSLIDHVSDNFGRQVQFGYQDGNLAQVTDTLGKEWAYQYDGHLLSQVIDPEARTILNTAYADGKAVAQYQGSEQIGANQTLALAYEAGDTVVTDGNGHQRSDQYDSRDTNAAQEFSEGFTVGKQFDPNFRPETITLPDPADSGGGLTTGLQWSADGQRLEQITDAQGAQVDLGYDASSQNLTSISDPRSDPNAPTPLVSFAYDDPGHPTLPTSTQDAAGNRVAYVYTDVEGSGLQVTTNKLDPAGSVAQTTTTQYDPYGRVLWVEPNNDAAYRTGYTYTYVAGQGQQVRIDNPGGRVDELCYDPADRLVRTVLNLQTGEGIPDGCDVAYAGQDSRVTSNTYDDSGNLILVVDPRGAQTRTFYDAHNRPETVVQNYTLSGEQKPERPVDPPAGSNVSENLRTDYYYDLAGNLIAAIDPRGVITRTYYDSLDRLVEVVSNLVGESGQSVEEWIAQADALPFDPGQPDQNVPVRYLYDAAGNRVAQIDLHLAEDGTPYEVTTRTYYDAVRQPAVVVQNLSDWDALDPQPPDCNQTGVTCDETHNVRTDTFYDQAGNSIASMDPLGVITRTYYDAINRPNRGGAQPGGRREPVCSRVDPGRHPAGFRPGRSLHQRPHLFPVRRPGTPGNADGRQGHRHAIRLRCSRSSDGRVGGLRRGRSARLGRQRAHPLCLRRRRQPDRDHGRQRTHAHLHLHALQPGGE